MISLASLPLGKLANEHYNELQKKTLEKFNEIYKYFRELKNLQAKPLSDIVAFCDQSPKEKRYTDSSNLYDPDLYKDCVDILYALEKYIIVTLKGSPKEIDDLTYRLKANFKKYELPSTKFGYKEIFQPFINALKHIWNYDTFITKQTNPRLYNAYRLAAKLQVNTCPYCNRYYTYTVSLKDITGHHTVKEDEIARPEFDHFYSKSRYPYLGISFYNLIPCCTICNSTLKGEIEMTIDTHCHPYLEGYEDVFNFETGITIKDFLKNSKPNVPVIFVANKTAGRYQLARAKATHSVFKIEKIYPYHSDLAEELFQKSTEDSKKLIESFWNQVSPMGNYLFETRDELYRHFIGNYFNVRDFIKRPLAKFQYDILKETKVIQYIKDLPERPDFNNRIPINKV